MSRFTGVGPNKLTIRQMGLWLTSENGQIHQFMACKDFFAQNIYGSLLKIMRILNPSGLSVCLCVLDRFRWKLECCWLQHLWHDDSPWPDSKYLWSTPPRNDWVHHKKRKFFHVIFLRVDVTHNIKDGRCPLRLCPIMSSLVFSVSN